MPRDTIPPEALCFAAALAKLEKAGADGRRKLTGVAYSGDRVPNGFFGGDIVIDCATSKVQGESLGVLYQHNPDKIVGSGQMRFAGEMTFEGLLSKVTDDAKRVGDLADEGFPWQMSIRVEPGEIDEVRAGNTVKVNGREFAGPITVLRNNLIREVSITPVGRDAQTSAAVFSLTKEGPSMPPSNNQPTIETLQTQVTELTNTVAKLTADHAAEKSRADAAAAELSASRKEQVKTLFAARGITFSDEAAKPFLEMSAVQFAAAVQLVPAKQARDQRLFSVDADDKGTSGEGKSSLVETCKAFGGQKS